jgi:3-oxoacyl-[acyl-carrier protein] reductase
LRGPTKPPAGASTIDVQGKEIEVGVNPDLLGAIEQMIPPGPAEATDAVYLFC